jgi:adenine-specific DNA methylase
MKLTKIDLSQIKTKINDDEKMLMVYLGNLYAEIYILLNSYLCSRRKNENPVVNTAQFCQSLFFIETLAGKLWGGWEVITKKYFGSKLSQNYNGKMSNEAKNAIKKLKKYFNQPKNNVKRIRHEYASHVDIGSAGGLPTEFDRLHPDDLCMYLSTKVDNNFFLFAESIMIKSLFESDDIKKAHDDLLTEIIVISHEFLHLIFGFFRAALKIHGVGSSNVEEIEIPAPPSFWDRELPYFLIHEQSETRK